MQTLSLHKSYWLMLLAGLLVGNDSPQAHAFGVMDCCDPPRAYHTPECHETWGYHQQCWRKFPPLKPCAQPGDYCPTCQPAGPNGTLPYNGHPAYGTGNVIYDGSSIPAGTPLQLPQQSHPIAPSQGYSAGHAPMLPAPTQSFAVPQQTPPTAVPQGSWNQSVPGTPQPMQAPASQVPASPLPSNGQGDGDAFRQNTIQPLPIDPSPMDENSLPPAGQLPGQTSTGPQHYSRTGVPVRPVTQTSPQGTQQWHVPNPPYPGQAYPVTNHGVPVQNLNGTIVYPANVEEATARPGMGTRIVEGLKHFRSELFAKPNPQPLPRDVQPPPATYGQPVYGQPGQNVPMHSLPAQSQPIYGEVVKPSLWSRITPW